MSNSFYRDRILWRAGKHRLLDRRCILYSDASDEQSAVVGDALGGSIDGVLLFWESRERWTLLAETFVASYHHDNLNRCNLDAIDKQMSVPSLAPDVESPRKHDAEYILLKKSGQLIWAPNGNELFALMNILLMFPLRKSTPDRSDGTQGNGTAPV
ncbi:hypothetical protein ACFJIW_05895 [Tahibacter sp. UC22_41]|uniref:hypothetical protein n=1 Tax=Tahibacter sp. UC22_41 TaxID=3350178 RepID=UPI0036DEEF2F